MSDLTVISEILTRTGYVLEVDKGESPEEFATTVSFLPHAQPEHLRGDVSKFSYEFGFDADGNLESIY